MVLRQDQGVESPALLIAMLPTCVADGKKESKTDSSCSKNYELKDILALSERSIAISSAGVQWKPFPRLLLPEPFPHLLREKRRNLHLLQGRSMAVRPNRPSGCTCARLKN